MVDMNRMPSAGGAVWSKPLSVRVARGGDGFLDAAISRQFVPSRLDVGLDWLGVEVPARAVLCCFG